MLQGHRGHAAGPSGPCCRAIGAMLQGHRGHAGFLAPSISWCAGRTLLWAAATTDAGRVRVAERVAERAGGCAYEEMAAESEAHVVRWQVGSERHPCTPRAPDPNPHGTLHAFAAAAGRMPVVTADSTPVRAHISSDSRVFADMGVGAGVLSVTVRPCERS